MALRLLVLPEATAEGGEEVNSGAGEQEKVMRSAAEAATRKHAADMPKAYQ